MGHYNHRYTGDPLANTGVWSPPTSAANFCEEDYAFTRYLAEFINTISNLAYVYFALRYPNGSARRLAPRRLDMLSWTLFLVGVTSAIFHATLKQTTQFSDDLSMLLLAACLMFRLYAHGRSAIARLSVAAIVYGATVGVSIIYVQSGDIRIHMLTFTVMLWLIWPRTLFLILSKPRSDEEKSRLIRLFLKAVAVLVFAFVIWNIDLEKCLELREIRKKIGLPWAWSLELHGWWHVLTAVGAAKYFKLTRLLCDTT